MKSFKVAILILMSVLSLTEGAHAQSDDMAAKKKSFLDRYYDETLVERIRGPQDVEYFYDNATYLEFLSSLAIRKSSTRATRVIKLAVERLKEMIAEEKAPYARDKFLDEIKIISAAGMYYAHKNKDRVLVRYFHKLHNYELVQRSDSSKNFEPKEDLVQILREHHRHGLEIITNAYLNRVVGGIQKTPDIMDYMGTRLEVFYEEIKSGEKFGNVTPIVPKGERKKVHTIRILVPSEHAAEAVTVATEMLLNSPLSDGVYFDDRLKIPSKLPVQSYALSNWGTKVLLTRPVCANLFQ